MTFIKEAIKQAKDLPFKTVHVPEWNCDVILSCMDGKTRDVYDQELNRRTRGKLDSKGNPDPSQMDIVGLRIDLLAHTMMNEDGTKVFDSVKEAREILNTKSSVVIGRLWDEARELNGMGNTEVERLRKNLPKEDRKSVV